MKRNIIITSEMRVGSRWLHYLLAALYDMTPSPEIDVSQIEEYARKARQDMQASYIVKYHHATPEDIFNVLTPIDYHIIGVVRNPRDRGVSWAFHMRYDESGAVRHFDSDSHAVDSIVRDQYYKTDNARQIDMMVDGYSTRLRGELDLPNPYIWTTYEWMKEDIVREVASITEFLDLDYDLDTIREVCECHSFNSMSGRETGEERRKDHWRRKGITGDWINWFTTEHYELTKEQQDLYWRKLIKNSGD